jgi:hypothetical protein
MTEQFANFVNVTLGSPCGPGDATITVTNFSGLPATGTFSLLVENEIMEATARSSGTVSVNRGMEGTTAASHGLGIAVKNIITARSIAQLKADLMGAVSSGTPPLLFTTGFATVSSADNIPANAVITRFYVQVTSAFNVGAVLTLGRTGSTALLLTSGSGSLDLTVVAPNDFPCLIQWGSSALPVLATYSWATQGAATIFVEYALPGD